MALGCKTFDIQRDLQRKTRFSFLPTDNIRNESFAYSLCNTCPIFERGLNEILKELRRSRFFKKDRRVLLQISCTASPLFKTPVHAALNTCFCDQTDNSLPGDDKLQAPNRKRQEVETRLFRSGVRRVNEGREEFITCPWATFAVYLKGQLRHHVPFPFGDMWDEDIEQRTGGAARASQVGGSKVLEEDCMRELVEALPVSQRSGIGKDPCPPSAKSDEFACGPFRLRPILIQPLM